MPSKIDSDLFIEAWEMKPALWNVNSEEYKNRNTRTKSLKKLVEHFNVSGRLVIIYYYFVFSFWNCSYARIQQTFIREENFLIFLEGDIKTKINTLCSYYSKGLAKTTNKKSGSGTNDRVESKWEYFIQICKTFIQTCLAMEPFQMYWNRDKSYLDIFIMACVVIASS